MASVTTSEDKTTSANGVVTRSTGSTSSGTTVSPTGETTATKDSTHTTTVR
jgi:hypothetical protein